MSDRISLDLGSSEADPDAVQARLEDDIIAWLVTVRPDGRPHAVPVWFLWRDGVALIMSEPDTTKVRNVRAGGAALLHLHTEDSGNGVVILAGTAVISDRDSSQWLPEIRDDYVAKYDKAMVAFGAGLEEIAERFSTVIEFTPTRLDAW